MVLKLITSSYNLLYVALKKILMKKPRFWFDRETLFQGTKAANFVFVLLTANWEYKIIADKHLHGTFASGIFLNPFLL